MLELADGGEFREAVPRADIEAIITAEHVVADERTKLDGDRTFQLDREIADAEAGVELVRRDDGARRAGVDAAMTGAAVFVLGLVGFQFEVRQDFGEKNPI